MAPFHGWGLTVTEPLKEENLLSLIHLCAFFSAVTPSPTKHNTLS